MNNRIINKPFKIATILILLCLLLFSIGEHLQVSKLQDYVKLVNKTYKIPTGQSIKSAIPSDFKFTHQDAFGIMMNDTTNLLNDKYLIDPNHENKFYWLNSSGKEIDLSNQSQFLYIGIPLKPEDVGSDNPENITYVKQVYQDFISTFERSGFKINKSFSTMSIYGFDNQVSVNITAIENSIGTRCEIRQPAPYSFSEFSKAINLESSTQIGCYTLAYIYVACVDGD
jgi:hypothetical protein